MDDGLVALDRVVRGVVARGLGARDGALQCVGAGGVGHVRELLGADVVVLEGRRVLAARVGPLALGVDVRERRDGVRVVDHRDGRGYRSVVRVGRDRASVLRRGVPRGADARVALGSCRGIVSRVQKEERHDGGHEACDYSTNCDATLRHGEAPNGCGGASGLMPSCIL